MPTSNQFYQRLPELTSFVEVLQKKNHHSVPEDWWIALTDVVNSTVAIEAGRYKDVNTAGALAAMAISNVSGDMDFPFIFGGDGVNCLIPPQNVDLVHDVLYDTQLKVKTYFDLELRVALIPVRVLYSQGYRLEVAKLKVSQYYNQAIISGNGLMFAEYLMKDKVKGQEYLINHQKNKNLEADFTGFTCRWQDIPSEKGETISTIIHLREKDNQQLLSDILKELYKIFGSEEDFHPITSANINVAKSEKYLGVEAKVSAKQRTGWKDQLRLRWIKFEALVMRLAIWGNLPIKRDIYQVNKMKEYQIAASDFKKFDGSLKMVLTCESTSRMHWEQYLETLRQEGKVYYGIHIADRAIMTCLLHAGSEKEVHFVDAADGGYALAAKQLKKQMSTN